MQEGYGFITFENEDCIQRAVQACQNVIVQGITLKCTITHQHNPIGSKKGGNKRSPTHAALAAAASASMTGAANTPTAAYYHNGSSPASVVPQQQRGPMQGTYPAHGQGPAALQQSFQPLTNQMSFLQQAKAHQMPVPQSLVIGAGSAPGSSAASVANAGLFGGLNASSFPQQQQHYHSHSSHSPPHHLSDTLSTTSSLESSDMEHRYSNSSHGHGQQLPQQQQGGNDFVNNNDYGNGLMNLSSLGGVFGNGNNNGFDSNAAAMDALTMSW